MIISNPCKVLVVHPGDVVFGELLEDTLLSKTVLGERDIIAAVASASTGSKVSAVLTIGYVSLPGIKS